MKNIVVGYDNTEPSQRALERAAQFTKALGANLAVVSVAPLAPGGVRGGGGVRWRAGAPWRTWSGGRSRTRRW